MEPEYFHTKIDPAVPYMYILALNWGKLKTQFSCDWSKRPFQSSLNEHKP